MKNINSVEKLKNSIQELKGKQVFVFGQPQIIEEKQNPYVIDILDILENLVGFESELITTVYNEETGEDDEIQYKSIEEYINILENNGEIKYIRGDNTYNWQSNINNNVNFHMYEHQYNGTFLVVLKVHLYGDIRSHYTEEVLLEFSSDYEFYESLIDDLGIYQHITVDDKDYFISTDILTEGYMVENSNGDYLGEIYGYYENKEEIIDDIKNLINN